MIIKRTIEYETIIQLNDIHLIEVLKNFPAYADIDFSNVKEIFVRVPGGGDWSHMKLGICDDNPIQIYILKYTDVQLGSISV